MENSYKKLELTIVSSLLHDVGKLVLRARPESYQNFYKQQGAKYRHDAAGAKFIEEIDAPEFGSKMDIAWLVASHHSDFFLGNDDEELKQIHRIIKLADWIASGERLQDEMYKEEGEKGYSERRLLSPFSSKEAPSGFFLPGKPLFCDGEINLFPRAGYDWGGIVKELKKALETINWERFGDGSFYVSERLYYIIMNYFWAIPSQVSFKGVGYRPNISLFAHSHLVAAIAVIIALLDRIPASKEEFSGYWIIGDLSGIQKFIFDIPSSGAAKSLRGRSQYLEFLTEAVAREILDRLGLPFVNILHCGAGSFLLLAPDRSDIGEKLNIFQKELDEFLFKEHLGVLRFNLAWNKAFYKDFVPRCEGSSSGWKATMDRLFRKLHEVKSKPFSELPSWRIPFEPTKDVCAVCGSQDRLEEEEEVLCFNCRSFKKLTADLIKRENVLWWGKGISGYGALGKATVGWGVFFGARTQHGNLFGYAFGDSAKEVWDKFIKCRELRGFKFVVKNIPLKENEEKGEREILSFDKISEFAEGDKKLGAVKGDVDNLGVFLREQPESFSVYHTTSLFLQAFFTFGLSKVFRQRGGEFYVVFTGGDDFFVIGPWDKILWIAENLRKDFEKMVGHVLSFSASFIKFHPKYPVFRLAEAVNEELERAKSLREIKDMFSIQGVALSWDKARFLFKEWEDWQSYSPDFKEFVRAFAKAVRAFSGPFYCKNKILLRKLMRAFGYFKYKIRTWKYSKDEDEGWFGKAVKFVGCCIEEAIKEPEEALRGDIFRMPELLAWILLNQTRQGGD